jgi:hypothetical protein
MVDPAVVPQKVVVDPPESYHVTGSESPGTIAAAQSR